VIVCDECQLIHPVHAVGLVGLRQIEVSCARGERFCSAVAPLMRTKINQIGRRDFLKASALTSALTSGAFFINTKFATGNLSLPPGSPPTTPFISRLKFAPWAVASAPSPSAPPVRPEEHQRFAEFLPQRYYEIAVREVQARPHPQLGLSKWSSYGGSLPGPTFVQRYGEPALVRFKNELPAIIQGFGVSEIIIEACSMRIALVTGNPALQMRLLLSFLYRLGAYTFVLERTNVSCRIAGIS
jgi:hypothetical protein